MDNTAHCLRNMTINAAVVPSVSSSRIIALGLNRPHTHAGPSDISPVTHLGYFHRGAY